MRYLILVLATFLTVHAETPRNLSRSEVRGSGKPRADVAEYFLADPTLDPQTILAGAALDRLTYRHDPPAFRGDRPGSLSALYDSALPAGLLGFPLPLAYDEAAPFTAAVVFVIDPDDYEADPFGFFQISWGLWNSATTGLNRTGNLEDFGADTYELLEFDFFPNVSPNYGGPFLAPTAFGVADPSANAFNNAAFSFGVEVALPLGVPLLAVLEHRPDVDALTATIYRIVGNHEVLPLPGAVAMVALDQLSERAYQLDTVGLTLWNDGFGGAEPAVRATLTFHSIIAAPGLFGRPGDLLRVPPRRQKR